MRAVDLLTQKMIEKQIIKESDQDIYKYGLENSYLILINVLTTIIIGIFAGRLVFTLVFLLSFITLRSFAGGFHLESKFLCYIVSNLILIVPLFGQEFFYQFTTNISRTIMLALVFLVIMSLSPVECRNRKYDSIEKKIFRKLSRIILTIQVVIYALLVCWGMHDFAYAIITSLFVIVVLLILGQLDLKLVTK